MILLDANILLRLADNLDPLYKATLNAVFLKRQSDILAIVPQSIYEFWAVATRPRKARGLEMEIERAQRWTARLSQMFVFLPDPPGVYAKWQELVVAHRVKGFRIHNARYVAVMSFYGISDLMTHNLADFKDFPIRLIDPTAV